MQASALPPDFAEALDTGATLKESFEVPGNEARYAVVNYWAEDDSPELTWLFQREPVGFA